MKRQALKCTGWQKKHLKSKMKKKTGYSKYVTEQKMSMLKLIFAISFVLLNQNA